MPTKDRTLRKRLRAEAVAQGHDMTPWNKDKHSWSLPARYNHGRWLCRCRRCKGHLEVVRYYNTCNAYRGDWRQECLPNADNHHQCES